MIENENIVTGKQILEIITSGMYSNPLMVIREYIQNSVDSIDQALNSGFLNNQDDAFIKISVNGQNRIVAIIDNGTGIPNDKFIHLLCSLGISSKANYKDRGFRGIGRLGGLGYCDKLVFETRSSKKERVGVIVWDGIKIRELCSKRDSIIKVEDVIKKAVTVDFRNPYKDESAHFFKIILENVHRFHKDHLMNLVFIKNYLEQVAPLPYNMGSFSFSNVIDNHLSDISGFNNYKIYLNEKQLYRPYQNTFQVNTNHNDEIKEIELIKFCDSENKVIGKGWYAITNFLSALPVNTSMRGVRLRQGNIEIGNEYYLADLYSERRFSTWHIGEIHLNYTVKVNARRDDFENSREYESFLEQASILGKHLSQLCRESSKKRSNINNIKVLLGQADKLLNRKFIIDVQHSNKLHSLTRELILKIEKYNGDGKPLVDQINKIKDSLNCIKENFIDLDTALDGRTLRHINKKTLIKKIASDIMNYDKNYNSSEALLIKVLEPYLVQKHKAIFMDHIEP